MTTCHAKSPDCSRAAILEHSTSGNRDARLPLRRTILDYDQRCRNTGASLPVDALTITRPPVFPAPQFRATGGQRAGRLRPHETPEDLLEESGFAERASEWEQAGSSVSKVTAKQSAPRPDEVRSSRCGKEPDSNRKEPCWAGSGATRCQARFWVGRLADQETLANSPGQAAGSSPATIQPIRASIRQGILTKKYRLANVVMAQQLRSLCR